MGWGFCPAYGFEAASSDCERTMLKHHHRQLFVLLMFWDALAIIAVFFGALLLPSISGGPALHRLSDVDSSIWIMAAAGLVSWPIVFRTMDLYASMRTAELTRILLRVLVAGVATSTILAAIAFVTSAPVQPYFPVVCGMTQAGILALARLFLFLPLRAARRHGRNFRNVLIVGTGPRASHVKRSIEARPDWGLRVVGFVDDQDTAVDPSLHNAKIFKLESMPDLLRDQVIDRVIIAYPRSMLARLSPVVGVCASAGIPFTMLADLFGDYLPPPQATQFGALAALEFAPVHHSPAMLAVKRLVDIVGAALALIAMAPVLALAALAIRLGDGGPILFRQIRCGLNGRPFTMLKLRTMCEDAEARKVLMADLNECEGPIFKMREDPRITRVGKVLRKLSIDELPQFWNVLRGDMSLVGPRPPVPQEVIEYKVFERRRLSMRPGITCIWQVSGRSKIGFDQWVQLDVKYIDSWSLSLDFLILLRTLPAVLKGDGAH